MTPDANFSGVNHHSPASEKISLFRSLFRGREDVWARRFESRRTGKSGYAPACANEWVRGVCEKPKVRCADCPQRRFLPLDEDVIRWHLSGVDAEGKSLVAGIYPMLLDESCFFLAVDFDKGSWRDDAAAFLETCRKLSLPASLERSRSGKGAHVWLFFTESVPAALARQLGSYILTETMERRPEIGFDSYDRLFPNQDTLPRGGFGNLIALPLQKAAREAGNSLFIDDAMVPHEDQWGFLASVARLPRASVEAIAAEAQRAGRVLGVRVPPDDEGANEPWTMPASRSSSRRIPKSELPERLDLTLSDQLYIPKDGLSPSLRNRLIRTAAFQNPEFYRAQAMRLPTWKLPRIVACAEDLPNHIGLPRGCREDVTATLADLGVALSLRDERCLGSPLDVQFQGELRPDQQTAADAMLAHDTGVLSAATAFGKTVIAAWLIAKRGASTLVLVHRRQLLDQWVERLAEFLDVRSKEIGRIGGGRDRATGLIDVALIQSLGRKGVVDDRVGEYGHLIVDECHHVPAFSFELVARRAKARFVAGFSATVARKDGHQPIIFMQCGHVRHVVSGKSQAAERPFRHTVVVRPTAFVPRLAEESTERESFQQLCRQLAQEEARNRMIVEDALIAVREGRSPLVLTERNDHLDALERMLDGNVQNLIVLRGGMGVRQRKAITERLAAIPRGEGRVLLATGRYVGEGFDDARLDTLLLTMPVSWRGTVTQYIGRLHRLFDGKDEVRVLDYADVNDRMLGRMFDKRCRAYEAAGYSIVLPASAVAGWPVDVTLPADPGWKRDYTGSVRRLVRDGVDPPLARLFVGAALPLAPDAEGAARARSTAEAFLFRRLESLVRTSGCFRLNAELPIVFDGAGRMEVDLLCAESRIAVEIDGAQHLADPDAYRRDRRKDRLLQAHGYLVLRFLSEDVTKALDTVLDSILQVMEVRCR
jgi:superfamily II DNA or RNA helicase/very-short-patch-repair endonuclease